MKMVMPTIVPHSLEHPYLREIRCEEEEMTATQPIDMAFDARDMTGPQLRELLQRQVLEWHPKSRPIIRLPSPAMQARRATQAEMPPDFSLDSRGSNSTPAGLSAEALSPAAAAAAAAPPPAALPVAVPPASAGAGDKQ